MILVLHTNGSATLEEGTDFRRFHLEVMPGVDEAKARSLFTLGEIASHELAWVDEEALYALGEKSQAPGWRAKAQAMVAAAAKFGWVREQSPAIKTHIVWRR